MTQFFTDVRGEVFAFDDGINPYDWGHAEGELTKITKEKAESICAAQAANDINFATPEKMSLRDSQKLRLKRMAKASAQATHFDMMGDSELAAAWRSYYRELHAFAASPEWPLVEQWPAPPTA